MPGDDAVVEKKMTSVLFCCATVITARANNEDLVHHNWKPENYDEKARLQRERIFFVSREDRAQCSSISVEQHPWLIHTYTYNLSPATVTSLPTAWFSAACQAEMVNLLGRDVWPILGL